MIKDQIIKIKKAKEVLCENKKGIKSYFDKKYPVLTGISSYEMESKIEKGLEILLSSSLKFKTTKIKIYLPLDEYRTYVNLKRQPGLHYANLSYGLELFDNDSQKMFLNKNLNFIFTDKYWSKEARGKVAMKFSILKNHKLVDQEKLMLMIKLRAKAIKAQKESRKILDINDLVSKMKSERDLFKVSKNLRIDLSFRGFDIQITKNREAFSKEERSYYDLASFEPEYLKYIIRDWNLLEKRLIELEKQKKRMVRGFKQILIELDDANRAYLVLEKLSK